MLNFFEKIKFLFLEFLNWLKILLILFLIVIGILFINRVLNGEFFKIIKNFFYWIFTGKKIDNNSGYNRGDYRKSVLVRTDYENIEIIGKKYNYSKVTQSVLNKIELFLKKVETNVNYKGNSEDGK